MLAFDQPTSRPVGMSPADCVRALRKFCADVNWVAMTDGCFGASRYWHAFKGWSLVTHTISIGYGQRR